MRIDRSAPLVCLRFGLLAAVPGFRHAVTTRLGGGSVGPWASSNLGLSVGDDPTAVLANRTAAAALVSAGGAHPATVRQVHGVTAIEVRAPGMPGSSLGDADALLTSMPGVPLLVQAADCAPLIVLDPVRRAAAAVHAGWRGTAAGAGHEAIASMQRLFGSRPADLVVGIGPAIGVCCYQVGEAVAAAAVSASDGEGEIVDRSRGERPYLDLAMALRLQLQHAGVQPARIEAAGLCTACNLDLLYSHRREGAPTGRFGALVAIEP